MDIIQKIALIILGSLAVYFVITVFTLKNPLNPQGPEKNGADSSNPRGPQGPEKMADPSNPTPQDHPYIVDQTVNDKKEGLVGNLLPTPEKLSANIIDAASRPDTSIYNPDNQSGILPQNQKLYDVPVDFGSDVTNIKHFYKNNPEIFGKILGDQAITGVVE